jgi:hypothetical protein
MKRRGGVLPAALFLSLACATIGILFASAAAIGLERQRAATACDAALLSAMRVRRDGLETIAMRWQAFGGDIGVSGGILAVDPVRWSSVFAAADALRRSISGFQGRVTSALTVALDANRLPAGATRAVGGTGLRLGVTARTEIVDVGGIPASLPGAWYARGWRAADAAPPVSDGATVSLTWPVVWLGNPATIGVASSGLLEWDADLSDPSVAASGRGGFARSLADGISGSTFSPHLFTVFRAARDSAS